MVSWLISYKTTQENMEQTPKCTLHLMYYSSPNAISYFQEPLCWASLTRCSLGRHLVTLPATQDPPWMLSLNTFLLAQWRSKDCIMKPDVLRNQRVRFNHVGFYTCKAFTINICAYFFQISGGDFYKGPNWEKGARPSAYESTRRTHVGGFKTWN